MPRLLIYVCGVFGAVFSIAGILLFWTLVLRGRKQAEAEILSASVEQFEQNDEGVPATLYRSTYNIRFQAGGRSFTVPVRSRTGTSRREAVEAKLRNNPVGSRRHVYYRPERPEDVELDPVLRRAGFSLLFLSIGFTILGASAIFWFASQPFEW